MFIDVVYIAKLHRMPSEHFCHRQSRSDNMHTEHNSPYIESISSPTSPNGTRFTTVPAHRSSSIPLPSSHVARTQSEVQLSADQAAAEQRDNHMFYRLINGLRVRQQTATQSDTHSEGHFVRAEKSAAIILRARRSIIDASAANAVDDSSSTSGHSQQQHIQAMWTHHGAEAARKSSESSANDGWSISGFDHGDDRDRQIGLCLHQDDDVEEEDDSYEGVFPFDL